MRTKNVEICIRVNEKEIYSILDKDFYIIYLQISNLKNKIYGLSTETIIACLEKIKSNFLEIYNSDKEEMEDGNN